MPRVARFRLEPIEDLHRQLAFAPPDARRRIMDAAEAIVHDVDHEQTYPLEYVVYRLTGFRSVSHDDPVTFGGADLIADLVNLIQRLSSALSLPADDGGRYAMSIDEVAKRLGVATRTVRRFRNSGLVCHVVVDEHGERRLACFEDSLRRFSERHERRVKRAGAFSRVDPATADAIVRAARQIRERDGLSLHAIASRLARRYGRATETVRRLLVDHDQTAERPIFGRRARLGAREGRRLERAWRYGIPLSRLGRRYDRTRSAIVRAVNRQRVDRVRRLGLGYVELSTFDLVDAETVILASPYVSTRLDELPARATALDLIALRGEPADEREEDALVAGYNLLKRRVRGALAAIGAWPRSADIDAIETDLRWAGRLQLRLLALTLPVVVLTIERNLGRPLVEQPSESILDLLDIGLTSAAATIETLDPSRGHRVDGRCSYDLDLRLASLDLTSATRRAAARHGGARLSLEAPLERRLPWRWLLLPTDWRRRIGPVLAPEAAHLVRSHFGLDATPPCTTEALARETGVNASAVARRISSAITALRRAGARG